VDAVCCDSACGALCSACAEAKTGVPDGECAPAPADTDPDLDCSGGDVCNGAGLCRCFDGEKDGFEPAVDCMGSCLATCYPACADQIQGDAETDVDCGGDHCPKCVEGKACKTGEDCVSGVCAGKACAPGMPGS
jgi:hypothetical protein